MKSIFKKRNLCVILVFVAILTAFLSFKNEFFDNNKESDIDIVLKSKAYAYLPEEAKDYIKKVYEETGEILLTEKNKQNNKPYLNPSYIDYLVSDEVIDTGYVPIELISQNDYSDASLGNFELPSKYDSRNVDGNSFVTSLKNQSPFNLCWDFSITSVIESKLLKDGFYSDSSVLDLSERMIDYATSDPITSIDIGTNPYYENYTLNALSDNGNSYRYTLALLNGLFPIHEDNWNYEYVYSDKVRPQDIYNLDNIEYETNEVLFLNDNNRSLGFDEDFNRVLKQYIIKNGSAEMAIRVQGEQYVRYVPNDTEQSLNGDGINTLYYKDSSATTTLDHSVAVIGWDDNYQHNVCVKDDGRLINAVYSNETESYTCSTGTLKELNGAWIIKNSAYGYDYVAYETTSSSYTIINDISIKNWDNVYHGNHTTRTFSKQNTNEKIESIKIVTEAPVDSLKIYIDTLDGNGRRLISDFSCDYGGMYTIKVEDDVILDQESFNISFSNGKTFGFTLFTSNMSENIEIDMDDAKIVNSMIYNDLLEDYKNVILLTGTSRNLDSSTEIEFVIKDDSGENVTNLFDISRNYSYGNYINSILRFNENVPLGEYEVYAYVDDVLYDTFRIIIDSYMEVMEGNGTIDNPYIITNPKQLDMIRLNEYAYYKLGNDIDLTYDTQNEKGLFYNDGLGWEPIDYLYGFNGGLDGDNHKIIGLYINRPSENNVGLFRRTFNANYAGLYFRNIIFEDVNITGKNYVGTLIGNAYGSNYERTLVISNISVSGSILGNNYVGGIIGQISGGSGLSNYQVDDSSCSSRHCFNNLFNSATVSGNDYIGGIVGLMSTQNYFNVSNSNWRSTIVVNNWQNIGNINSDINASGLVGNLLIQNGNTVTINNSISTGRLNGENTAGIVGQVNYNKTDSSYSDGHLTMNNIYYTDENGYDLTDEFITADNVKKYSIKQLTEDNIYNSFIDFNVYYKKETDRIPILKFVPFVYTSIDNITVNYGEEVNLYDYINPKIDKAKDVSYEIEDTTIATIDEEGNISGIKKGITSIHIISNYDGYENSIPITVIKNTGLTINYDANGGTGTMESTYIESGKSGETSANGFTRTGYIFKSWNTKADGTGTKYPVYEKIMNTEDDDWILNLYAIWEPINHNVVFYANNGTYEGATQVVFESVETPLRKNTFVTDGYIFKEWNTKIDGTGISYEDEEVISIDSDLHLYAQWEQFDYEINNYPVDEDKKYISEIEVNTQINDFTPNFRLGYGYGIEVDYKEIDDKQVLYTGGKTRIIHGIDLYAEYTNIVKGDVTGDGKINYLDYVNVYNHIQKVKHPDSDKKLLVNEYLVAADMSGDSKINYMDYVKIYNKIKELKGGNN